MKEEDKEINQDEIEEFFPRGEETDLSKASRILFRYDKGENTVISNPQTIYPYASGDYKLVDKEKNLHLVKKGFKHIKLSYDKKKPTELLVEKDE